MPRAADVFATVGFLAVISSAGWIQTAAELRRGERPQALEVFEHAPTADNLRAYEAALEDQSLVAKRLRPWAQYARFRLIADAGEKAVIGRDDWLFYRPGVQCATQRIPAPLQQDAPQEPLAAIVSFRDQLAARGIRLLVVPAPNKESIYPEMLTRRAEGAGVVVCRQTRELLDQLAAAGVETLDLFAEFRRAKQEQGPSQGQALYLVQDSHWSPQGVERAARAAARFLIERDWVERGATDYEKRTIETRRQGDVLQMLQLPGLERAMEPETIACSQVVCREPHGLYRDAADSQVLVLGDSFLRIYEKDEPGAAGFIAHLARELRQPLASIVSDGGASTLVRQDLYRRPELLENKKVVVWEFVERDLRFGMEGWQVIPLPPKATRKWDSARG